VSSFNRAAPFILKDDLMKSRAMVGVLGVVHMYIKFKVGVANSCHWNSHQVVKVLVVVVYEVLVCGQANYSHNATERELNMRYLR